MTKVTARPLGSWCPPWWSRSTIFGSTWQRWRTSTTRFLDATISQAGLFGDTVEGFCHQFSAVQKQTEAIQHILPQRDAPSAPASAVTGLRLPVAVGDLLHPPELLRPALNRHLSRHVKSLAEKGRPCIPAGPQVVQEIDEAALTWPTLRCWSLLFLRRQWGQHRSFPRRRAGWRILSSILFLFRRWPKGPLSQLKSNFLFLWVFRAAGRKCATRCLLTLTHDPSFQRPFTRWLCRWRHLHGIWKRGLHAQFNSATWFSTSGDLPSSAAFWRLRWQPGTLLSCVRRLLSSWQRMQLSRSLQPRWGRGFTALTSSYPRQVADFNQSWICESWTGPCTGSPSRCWCTSAWSNASSPRIGLQRSTWRMLTFMFRSFRNTNRSYGLRSKVRHGSTGSSPSGSPSLPVSSWSS